MFTHKLGISVGWLLSWIFHLIKRIRHRRAIHAHGYCFRALVTALEPAPGLPAQIANNLKGAALVRLSSTLWRKWEGFDGLGCAIRFGFQESEDLKHPQPNEQDVLFATTKSVWRAPGALFTTRAGDFFANEYYTGVKFDFQGHSHLQLRLLPLSTGISLGQTRKEKLMARITTDTAIFVLQVREPRGSWQKCAEVALEREVIVNQNALAFNPLSDGLGLKSRGFIQGLRKASYRSSAEA